MECFVKLGPGLEPLWNRGAQVGAPDSKTPPRRSLWTSMDRDSHGLWGLASIFLADFWHDQHVWSICSTIGSRSVRGTLARTHTLTICYCTMDAESCAKLDKSSTYHDNVLDFLYHGITLEVVFQRWLEGDWPSIFEVIGGLLVVIGGYWRWSGQLSTIGIVVFCTFCNLEKLRGA